MVWYWIDNRLVVKMAVTLDISAAPTDADLAIVGGELAAFNDADVGPSEKLPLAIFVRNETGDVLGGLSGYTAWGWLYVQWLWLSQELRGQGLARKLLAAAESEAIARGCHASYIDTFNPDARKAYERQGYSAFGELSDFPKGRTRVFLQKQLSPR